MAQSRSPNGAPLTTNESIQKLGEMIVDIHVAMLTTVDPDGSLYSRPMACPQNKFDGDLWFFTSRRSGKIHAIINDQHVNLGFADPKNQRYISVSGRAEIVKDIDKAKDLWSVAYKAWFPEGLRDPDLILIKVNVENAEYWDVSQSTVGQLVGFAKAVFTGERFYAGEHERLDLHH